MTTGDQDFEPSTSAAPDAPAITAKPFSSVLIANRGEIAVRIIRACHDAGLNAIAVYAEPDRDALHVRLADQAFALGGATPADSYLDIAKLLDVAARCGAEAIHPGYGFLSENSDFAQAVIDAGLTWIGPPPAAILALGDKVSARHIAGLAGAPLVPGTPNPVSGVAEVLEFADGYGMPLAIKAAFGGGGRGLKVARTREEIPELYASAVREAVVAFGRGECFVERYLDNPRHVETQCLADMHGNVVVVSTRDCSLQRRHQKLVEEAPAPFLTNAQNELLVDSSKAILRGAHYVGAGTCEFLVGTDGTISFLEVNTRLQVEHPVTEEICGIDLVREQFRIAAGEELGYDAVETHGHSFEFRINGENPYAGFMPGPGAITSMRTPSGPGVRLDLGFEAGDSISGAFDSMLGKLIVTGATRIQALERARRALSEFTIKGLPTVLPFHREVVNSFDFAPRDGEPFKVHTRWIETEFLPKMAAQALPIPAPGDAPKPSLLEPERVVVEVGGKRLEVVLPTGFGMHNTARIRKTPRRPTRRPTARQSTVTGNSLTSPMQGTIVKTSVNNGDQVEVGDLIVVLEAMKMEQPLIAHRAGTIAGLEAKVGETVPAGSVICEITD